MIPLGMLLGWSSEWSSEAWQLKALNKVWQVKFQGLTWLTEWTKKTSLIQVSTSLKSYDGNKILYEWIINNSTNALYKKALIVNIFFLCILRAQLWVRSKNRTKVGPKEPPLIQVNQSCFRLQGKNHSLFDTHKLLSTDCEHLLLVHSESTAVSKIEEPHEGMTESVWDHAHSKSGLNDWLMDYC